MINWVLAVIALIICMLVSVCLRDRLSRQLQLISTLPLLLRLLILGVGHATTVILVQVVLQPSNLCMLFVHVISGGLWNSICFRKYDKFAP